MDDSAENYMHLDSTSGQLISLEDQQKVVKTAAEQLLNLLAGICVAPASVMSWLPLESLWAAGLLLAASLPCEEERWSNKPLHFPCPDARNRPLPPFLPNWANATVSHQQLKP